MEGYLHGNLNICVSIMKIRDLEIHANTRPKIIAEIGINHGGCLDTAKTMADLALNSGADIIKTQLHIASEEMSLEASKLVPQHCDKSIYSIMEECSLSLDDEYDLKCHIEASGGIYLSTPFSAKAAHLLGSQFNVDAFKIGSGECNNLHVLDAALSYGKPLLISTGMNSLSSCRDTYSYVRNKTDEDILLLHTTNLYPTPFELVRLGALNELKAISGDGCVGLSDHTTNNLACLGAVAIGAVLLERHFTDSMNREGPDIANSMDPSQLSDLRRDSEVMFMMRGGSKENLLSEEQDTRNFAFATYVAKQHIARGSKISSENVEPKRPALGDFMAQDRERLIGKIAVNDISEGAHIRLSDISE